MLEEDKHQPKRVLADRTLFSTILLITEALVNINKKTENVGLLENWTSMFLWPKSCQSKFFHGGEMSSSRTPHLHLRAQAFSMKFFGKQKKTKLLYWGMFLVMTNALSQRWRHVAQWELIFVASQSVKRSSQSVTWSEAANKRILTEDKKC